MTQDRVCRGEMEKEIRYGVLDQVILTGHPLALPARLAHHFRRGASKIVRGETIEVSDDGAHAGLQLLERLFGVGLGIGRLTGEIRCGKLHCVAADLHLARQRKLVGRESQAGEYIRFEVPGLRVFGSSAEPFIQLAQLLLHPIECLCVHGGIRGWVSGYTRPPPPQSSREDEPIRGTAGGIQLIVTPLQSARQPTVVFIRSMRVQ